MSGIATAVVVSSALAYDSSEKSRKSSEAANNDAKKATDNAVAKSDEIGRLQLEESRRQYDLSSAESKRQYDLMSAESRRQYEESKALNAPIAAAQLGIMEQTKAQGADYDAYNKRVFRPVEEGLAADAAKFSTKEYADSEAALAAADITRAAENARAQSMRENAAMGVNPNSGRALALRKEGDIALAAAKAGVMNNARKSADALGWAKRLDVAGMGRNLPGASTAAYSTAVASGNSSAGNNAAPGAEFVRNTQINGGNYLGNINATGATLLNGINSSANTTMGGHNLSVSTANTIMNNAAAKYGADSSAVGSIIGSGIGAYGMYKMGKG